MNTFAQSFIIFTGLATSFVGAVSAQQNKSDTIEELTVTGRHLSLDKLNSVKTPTPIIDIPQSLSILTSEQIQQQAFRNVGDILRYTPGVSVSQGEGHRDAIIIRGVQTTADFYIDGLRDDVQYYRPLYNVEQVEILRGANALLFGRGGGGGVINRVQKKPVIGEHFSKLTTGVDTFGAYSFEIDSNFDTQDDSAFRINAYYQELDNHRDFYDGQSYAVNAVFAKEIAEDTKLTLSYEYVDDDRVIDRGVPSVVTADGANVPLSGFRDTFFGSPEANLTTLEAHIFKARLDHGFSDQLRGNVTIQYADYEKLYQNLFPSESVSLTASGNFNIVELDGYRDPTERDNLIVQANLVGEFITGPLEHTVLFGVEYGDQSTENARFDNVFAQNNDDQLRFAFTDPLAIPSFSFDKLVRDRESEVEFVSVYLQDQVTLFENFIVVLGVRYDEFDIDVLDRIEQNDGDANDGNFSRTDTEVTPRGGFIYKPAENVSIYASYSESFLPRSGDQFLTLNLDTQNTRPQFFENKEIGIKWDITPKLSITSAVFELDRESFVTVDPEDQGRLITVDGSETTGVEVELLGELTDKWSIAAGYAYLDGEVEDLSGNGRGSNDGNVTRQTPENMFSLWNNYQFNEKFSFGVGMTYQDDFFVREDNNVLVPSFTRFDAALYYQFSEGLKAQVNIENLFGTAYFPDAHSNTNISTGKPFNARFTVSYEF